MADLALVVRLFGEFSLIYDDAPVMGVNSARLQSLLTYLILHADVPQLRHRVAFMFWPDASESQARNNLRQFLYQLRHVLPEPDRFLVVDGSSVFWKTDDLQVIDVLVFKQAIKEAYVAGQRGDLDQLQHMLERAILHYQGELLPACYEDWITAEREQLRQGCLTACQKLVSILESRRQYAAPIQAAQSWLRLDPLNESSYVSLLRLPSLNNNYLAARRIYLSAVEILDRELGVAPGEMLQPACDRLGHVPIMATPDGSSDGSGHGPLRLVGRIAEWNQLQAAWQHAEDAGGRAVLIIGEAGIGKSRLAEINARYDPDYFFYINQNIKPAAA